jgi:hypothetical protein
MHALADPTEIMRLALLRVQQRDAELQATGMLDPQEDQERLDATVAYLGEDEQHFVSYVEEFVRTSAQANYDIRATQQECWAVYQEDPPPNYAAKEDWQSRVIIPKPHGAVQFGMAAVKQAFSTDFLSATDDRNPKLAEFWRRLLEVQFNRHHANFARRFTRAAGMGFAVGQSFEFIPLWRPGRGLDFSLVEPWKIHRDPDALSEEPQSGMAWVHEEWVDVWQLREGERQGRYVHTDDLQTVSDENNPQNWQMDRQRTAELRRQLWTRNPYRQATLTREFYGTMLSKRGELLHPNLTFTTAGNRVIGLPRPTPYATLRWPGMSFSPLPNFLRFEGRSLLQSVRSLWYFMCNLQALHNDYLNWQVNPMREVNQQALVDQNDLDVYPGKLWLTRNTVSGQQVVRTVDHRFTTNEVLANKQSADQDFQRGTFITDPIQGLPGFRQQITARESAQNLQQSLTVFSIIGENLDAGALEIARAAMETIMLNITREELLDIFALEELVDYFGDRGDGLPTIFVDDPAVSMTGVQLPALRGTFHISGLQSLLKDFETIGAIRDILLPLSQNEMFQPYIKPHKLIKAVEVRSGLQDEDIVVEADEAEEIFRRGQESQAQLAQMQQQAVERQLALEDQRLQLEVAKADLEEQKLALEGQKMHLEAMQQAFEAEQARVEMAGMVAEHQAMLELQQAEIARIAAEIRQKEQEMALSLLKTDGDLRKVDAQIAKTAAQMALAEKKAALEARKVTAEIRAARNAPGTERAREE